MSKVYVTDNTDSFIARQNAAINAALRVVAEDVPRQAYSYTPRKSGDLRRWVTIQMGNKIAEITWTKEYAAAQEAGMVRGRPITKYTTPGTGKGYAKKGVDLATAKWTKTLRQALGSIT